MISGTTVDNLLVGGPAYSSKQLSQGDVILQVDSVEATPSNIVDLLVGNDSPGTPINIVVAKGGSQVFVDWNLFYQLLVMLSCDARRGHT